MSQYRLLYLDSPQREKPEPPRRGGCLRWLTLLLQLGLLGLLLLMAAAAGGYFWLSNELGGAIDAVVAYQGQGAGGTPRFFDRNGELLFELTTVEKRRWLNYDEIPDAVKLATVAVEDDTFWVESRALTPAPSARRC